MTEITGSKWLRRIVLVCCIVLSVALGAIAYAVIDRRQQASEVAQETARVLRLICLDNERDKQAERAEAFQNYVDAPVTLARLGIPYTPELEDLATESYREAIERYKPRDCDLPTN